MPSLTELLDRLRVEDPPISNSASESPDGIWEMFARSDDPSWTVILPPTRTARYFYRGQTKRYSPSRASIFRGTPTEERPNPKDLLALVVSLARLAMFVEMIEDHPCVRATIEKRIYLDPEVLAQHYHLPTPHMDLTSSLDVAAFFAVCASVENDTTPLPACEGHGVIYRIDRARLREYRYVQPIGLHAFPRPALQEGWAMSTRPQDDFEQLPGVEIFEFEHDAAASAAILCARGNLLPPDPLIKLATELRDYPVLTMRALRAAVIRLGVPEAEGDKASEFYASGVRTLGLEIDSDPDARLKLTPERIAEFAQSWDYTLLEKRIPVSFRLVRIRQDP